MANVIWLVAWRHYDDNYDYEWKSEVETEFGFFTTEAAAQAKADELNAGNKKSFAQAVEATERRYATALEEYQDRKQKWDKLQKYKAQHPDMPDLVKVPNPQVPKLIVPTWEGWIRARGGGYYEPCQLEEAV